MKIYIDGKDNVGWAIDNIRNNLSNSLKRLNVLQTTSYSKADIIHNIWWNSLFSDRFLLQKIFQKMQKKKLLIVTSTNYIDALDDNYFMKDKYKKIKKEADAWITPSNKQKRELEKDGCRAYYQPFFFDYTPFNYATTARNRDYLAKKNNIPIEKTNDKIIIGSFQRDSLGTDLSKPKWQKGPELLIEILKDMPKEKYILLLSSPRRHYVIDQCKKNKIPYYYIGTETEYDDIETNLLNSESMPDLYSLIDIYLVTSKSEGGPFSIMESAISKTFILSTDVGLASDFLNKENVFNNKENYKKRLFDLIVNFSSLQDRINSDIEEQYKRAISILNYDAMDKRLMNIYQDVIKLR